MSIATKLQSILSSVSDIKDAIEEKDVDMTNTPLEDFGDKIRDIQTGSGHDVTLTVPLNASNPLNTNPLYVSINEGPWVAINSKNSSGSDINFVFRGVVSIKFNGISIDQQGSRSGPGVFSIYDFEEHADDDMIYPINVWSTTEWTSSLIPIEEDTTYYIGSYYIF